MRFLPMCLIGTLLVCATSDAGAHEMDPHLLRLDAIDTERTRVTWKVPPSSAEVGLVTLAPQLPADCLRQGEAIADGRGTLRWHVACGANEILGQKIEIVGLSNSLSDVLVVLNVGPLKSQHVLTSSAPSITITAAPGFPGFVRLGFEHIFAGLDHLAFVLCLMILLSGPRALFATVSAFTVGHSATLALASLNIVRVPAPPVEALIAASIVLLAAQGARARGTQPKIPWGVALGFGLIHGLGFAGALRELLPESGILWSLLGFNLGVELGQLVFVAVVLLAATLMRKGLPTALPRLRWQWAPYTLGTLAFVWTLQRLS